MTPIDIDPEFSQGGVNYGRKMIRRLAVSRRDIPWNHPAQPRTSLAGIHERLSTALATIARWKDTYSGTGILDESEAPLLASIWELLEEIDHDLPKVQAWCVIKNYHRPTGESGWQPRVWTAHLTREQAEEFAPVIARHYASKARHTIDTTPHLPGHYGGYGDRFTTTKAQASIRDFVGPRLTAEEYVRMLGS